MKQMIDRHQAYFASFGDGKMAGKAIQSLEQQGFETAGIYAGHEDESLLTVDPTTVNFGKKAFWGALCGLIISVAITWFVKSQLPMFYGSHTEFAIIPLLPFVFVLCILFAAIFAATSFMVSSRLLPGQKNALYLSTGKPNESFIIACYEHSSFEEFISITEKFGASETWQETHIVQTKPYFIPINQNFK